MATAARPGARSVSADRQLEGTVLGYGGDQLRITLVPRVSSVDP
jgi:hypothetical protein